MFRTFILLVVIAMFLGCSGKKEEKKPPPPVACGGIGSFLCPDYMYCDLGPHCGGMDREGFCKKRPVYCTAETEELVCGCDGKTYKSPCYANTIGVTVRKKGPCEGAPPATI